jgi:two-component system, LuxR family, response regulator FixJ
VSEQLNVHIVEDDPIVRDCVCRLLEDEGLRVKTYASALDFLAAIKSDEKGCVVTDLGMPDMSGLALLTQIERRCLPLSVVVITGHADVSLAVQAMKKGAVDFIEKPFRSEILIASVRTALARQSGHQDSSPQSREILTRFATLTAREHEVLARIMLGQSNKIMAQDLAISPRTVETHRANLMQKMQARSVPQLVSIVMIAEERLG